MGAPLPRLLPVLQPRTARTTDRRITIAGIGVAALFLAAAVVSVLLPPESRHGIWLPLHLALAGAASVAIGAVMPFFAAAVTAAPPAPPLLRVAAIGLLGAGTSLAATGLIAGVWPVSALGAGLYLLGVVTLTVVTLLPLSGSSNSRRWLLAIAYGVAVADVALGVSLALLYTLRSEPVLAAWGQLKPAHAWLNVFGFVSLVIAGSLGHLLPTVAGVRIVRRTSFRVALGGIAVGPPLVAAGFALGSDAIGRTGALIALSGAAALALFALQVLRAPSGWTTERTWHRFSMLSLVLGTGWFVAALGAASGLVLLRGTRPDAWASAVLLPAAVGWVTQVLVGAWTHLVPSVGGGDQKRHTWQRSLVARAARTRLVLTNAGCVLLLVGVVAELEALVGIGSLLVAGSLAGSMVLLARSLLAGPASAVAHRQQAGIGR